MPFYKFISSQKHLLKATSQTKQEKVTIPIHYSLTIWLILITYVNCKRNAFQVLRHDYSKKFKHIHINGSIQLFFEWISKMMQKTINELSGKDRADKIEIQKKNSENNKNCTILIFGEAGMMSQMIKADCIKNNKLNA